MKIKESRETEMDRITEANGVYRWSYTLSKEQALVHYYDMLKISGIVTGSICLIMLIALHRFEGAWISVLAVFGGVFVLPALIGWFTIGWDTRNYEMDEQYIRHKHATKGGDAFIEFKKIQWMQVRGEVFTIKAGITTYTVYVPKEDVDFVKQYIQERRT